MNRGEVKCYGCGSTIKYVDAYVLGAKTIEIQWGVADEYYCEVCTDKMVSEGDGKYFAGECK